MLVQQVGKKFNCTYRRRTQFVVSYELKVSNLFHFTFTLEKVMKWSKFKGQWLVE